MEILTQDELALFVWNDQSSYREGLRKAQQWPRETARHSEQWVNFVIFALGRYSYDILKDYNAVTLPLEEWGTMAARFRSEFIEHLKEC